MFSNIYIFNRTTGCITHLLHILIIIEIQSRLQGCESLFSNHQIVIVAKLFSCCNSVSGINRSAISAPPNLFESVR